MTMFWTIEKLAAAAGGEILSGNAAAVIEAISTDTRKLTTGHCFIALAGENLDGHAFVPDAIEKGAGAVIVSEWSGPFPQSGTAVVKVRDTLYALGELARYHRKRFDIPVIAVSGSNGKSSTKEMVSAILDGTRKVLKNKGNFNNLIGLPLTLLELREEHQAAVVEMGINVPGEMARLAEIGSANVGIITNVHPAHLEGLGSLELIMEEKGKLWESLPPDGVAVVNLDDRRLSLFAAGIKARKITYSSKDRTADIFASSRVVVSEGKTSFRICCGGSEFTVALPVMGAHHAQNALAAAAAALGAGASPQEIEAGLATYEPMRQRMQSIKLRNGRVLIDDTYNANPGSMVAAVEAVCAASAGSPFAAVLGEMRELGERSSALHFDVGKWVGAARPCRLITLGQLGLEILKGAQAAGMDETLCFYAKTHEEAVAILLEDLPPFTWILVKGSRGMTMERVIEGMAGERV
ncbi:MAG: UDP-N-acetylmuramoyl-tripeptide--D-alanyl-D-alanine ligase [Syntrophobacteraceae bacterium]